MSWATCIVDQLKAYLVHFISYVPDFEAVFARAMRDSGPWIIVAYIEQDRSLGRPPNSPTFIKHRFMQGLGHKPA